MAWMGSRKEPGLWTQSWESQSQLGDLGQVMKSPLTSVSPSVKTPKNNVYMFYQDVART